MRLHQPGIPLVHEQSASPVFLDPSAAIPTGEGRLTVNKVTGRSLSKPDYPL